MNDTPLYTQLIRHKKKGLSPFHTPGHKCSGFISNELLSLDLTELPDTDALYEADGAILQAEIKLARLFGAKRTLISSGGCTLAIQAMLRIASQRGKRILFSRNIHRSAINACALLGIEPVWVMPRSESSLFTGRIVPDDIKTALDDAPDISACYITSPDYYGEISDIAAIAEICHQRGALLLVDNAHGSHLAFMKDDLHPIHLGADMTACSLHKTLPVLTGGAALNIGNSALANEAKAAMALFGSTSPSYPIMASIDLCRAYLEQGGIEEYKSLGKRISEIKTLAKAHGLIQPEGLCDELRICINTSCAGIEEAKQTELFHSFGIEPEFCDGKNAVLICTPFNSSEDLERVERLISSLHGRSCADKPARIRLPRQIMSPREAMLGETEQISTVNAAGRISADSSCPCPPGIPLIMPGELIDNETAELILRSGKKSICCVKREPLLGT